MFADFPKVFDKDFLIGFFLPSLIFVLSVVLFPSLYGFYSINIIEKIKNLLDMTIILLFIWVAGLFLLILNRNIIRTLEGYGPCNIFSILKIFELRRYRKIRNRIAVLEEKEKKNLLSAQEDLELTHLLYEIKRVFPDNEKWVLPTRFGNVLRAFEVYSRIMYGAEAVILWPRLRAIIPEDYKKIIDSNKTIVDFWVNLCLFSTILYLEGITLFILKFNWKPTIDNYYFILPIIGLFLIDILCYDEAINSGLAWGDTIKSAFDVFLPDLANKIGLKLPDQIELRYSMWNDYRRAVQFANPKRLPQKPVKDNTQEPYE